MAGDGWLECVVNISEGRNASLVADLARAASPNLLDIHSDADHNRSVLTIAGGAAAVRRSAMELARVTVATLDLRRHEGVHPRIGVLDVVPFVHLRGWPLADGDARVAESERDAFAAWASRDLALPCFLYGGSAGLQLPDVRRGAWKALLPDAGPRRPHPTAGAVAVGARTVLVAYNLWLEEPDLGLARRIAASIRSPSVRALGLGVGSSVQVSCNLVSPWTTGPGAVFDAVAGRATVEHAELVGLLPRTVLEAEPADRWEQLGLSEAATIEARLEQAGLDGGRFDRVGEPGGEPPGGA